MISTPSKGRNSSLGIPGSDTGASLQTHLRLRVKTITWERVTARQIDFLWRIFFTKALLADRWASSRGRRCSGAPGRCRQMCKELPNPSVLSGSQLLTKIKQLSEHSGIVWNAACLCKKKTGPEATREVTNPHWFSFSLWFKTIKYPLQNPQLTQKKWSHQLLEWFGISRQDFPVRLPSSHPFPTRYQLCSLPKYLKYLHEAQGAFVSQFGGKAGEECTWNSTNVLQEQLPEPVSSRTHSPGPTSPQPGGCLLVKLVNLRCTNSQHCLARVCQLQLD